MKKILITIEVNVPDNCTLEYLQVYAKDAFESWCGQHHPEDVLPPGAFSERGHRARVKVRHWRPPVFETKRQGPL